MRVLKMTRKAILARLKYMIKKKDEEDDIPLIKLKKKLKKQLKQEQIECELFSQSIHYMIDELEEL